jgi:hypothetical protein
MKKADWMHYASELECKLVKAEAEVEAVRNRQIEDVRAEIRREEKADWMQTGLQMAADELALTLEEMEMRDEISFDLSYRLRNALQSVVDSFDVASIVE